MPSVIINLTDEEHARLEAAADREGRTLGEIAKARVLYTSDKDADSATLAAFLEPRIRQAKEGNVVRIPAGTLPGYLQKRVEGRDD